ncbi:MAG TPA: MmcQ/YjbR family DNA-binding protein [Bryobacteraceae bacterium]|nr:MmcQ/YjbR family DNA-binding protein [Bryobacteraceae bacterium]
MTWDQVKKLALAMPKVEEGTSYGTPALKVKKKLIVRLREEGDVIVLKMPFDQRDAMMMEAPDKFFITDHYRDYEYVLVRLKNVTREEMRDLLRAAYKNT